MEKYGFVYLWYDKKHKRFYIGSHWGREDDGYICSSKWMKQAYKIRPQDFKRRILKRVCDCRKTMLLIEAEFINRIKPTEIKTKYYNLCVGSTFHWSATPDARTIAQKSADARRGKSLPAEPGRGAKISAAKKGKKFTEEHKQALKVARAKQTFSEESNKKRSESLKRAYAEGRKKSNPVGYRPKKIVHCLKCGAETPSRRASYCKEHRYEAMKETLQRKAK